MNLKQFLETPKVPNKPLSEAKVKWLRGLVGQMTYDEVMKLAKEADQTYSYLPLGDLAREYIFNQRYKLYQYASHLNIVDDLGRSDHLIEVQALVSVGSDVVEHQFRLDNYVVIACRNKEELIKSEVCVSLRYAGVFNHEDPEVVLL